MKVAKSHTAALYIYIYRSSLRYFAITGLGIKYTSKFLSISRTRMCSTCPQRDKITLLTDNFLNFNSLHTHDMVCFKMIPLTHFQMQHLQLFLESVYRQNGWLKLNCLLSPLTSDFLHSRESVTDFVASGGSAYYNYLQLQLKRDVDWQHNAKLLSSHTLYRYVWLCCDSGQVSLLCKSPIWSDCLDHCLTSAARYKPSIDYIDSLPTPSFVVTVENIHVHYPDIVHTPCSGFDVLTSMPAGYTAEALTVDNNTS